MIIKKILKKGFNMLGYDIYKHNPNKNDQNIDDELNTIYDLSEKIKQFNKDGEKFNWLKKKYNFKTIFDIGANEGQFAGAILKLYPTAKIHSFEPLHNTFLKLQENFKNNINVTPYNFALGKYNEDRDIFCNEYSPSSSLLEMLDLHKTNFDFAVKVQPSKISIRRLDDFFNQPVVGPVLLKIDVQGFEMNVLEGGKNVLKQADVLLIEVSFVRLYKDEPLFDDIYSYLVKEGFYYAGNVEQLMGSDNQILQADALFIRK